MGLYMSTGHDTGPMRRLVAQQQWASPSGRRVAWRPSSLVRWWCPDAYAVSPDHPQSSSDVVLRQGCQQAGDSRLDIRPAGAVGESEHRNPRCRAGIMHERVGEVEVTGDEDATSVRHTSKT